MRELDVAAIEERRHLALAGLVRAFPGIPSVLGLGVHGLDATDGPIDAVEQTVAGHLASVLVGLWRLGAGAPVRITDLEEAVEPGAVPKGFTDDLRVVVRLTGRDANPRGQVLPRDVVCQQRASQFAAIPYFRRAQLRQGQGYANDQEETSHHVP